MGYYIRILSPSDRVPSVERITAALSTATLAGTLKVEAGSDDNWTQLVLAHEDGPVIASIERDCALWGDLVAGEIEEFLDQIADCQPASSAAWLADYLPTVKTIYSFQLLGGMDFKDGWVILGKIKESIFTEVGGIIQADAEGFSNEHGYHILWQFSNSVRGPWWMGLLRDDKWVHFQMDLGNKKHRKAFLRGEVPEGVEVAHLDD